MKKSLVALAALAVVGAASAQSSVTLYGVVDAGVSRATGTKVQMMGSTGLNNGTSRFGFKGSEDLGGGLKANFNLEAGFDPENGASGFSGGQLFSRAANVSLAGAFGEFRMGRSLTPSFYGVAAWELTGTANYSVVASQFNFAGAGPRQSSQFMYVSPSFSGFSGSLAYTAKQDNGTAAVGATVANIGGVVTAVPAVPAVAGLAKVDANLIYANGPVTAALSYNKVQTVKANYALGGKYDFGKFQVAASAQDPAGNDKGFTLGAGANLGPVALVVDIARDTFYKDTNVLLEAKYPLSKRTFAYAAYVNDGAGKNVTKARGASLGLRHNF
jgi:predicted porin